MPYRNEPCCTSETYHIFNRSIARQPIFLQNQDYRRFINLLYYYRYQHVPVRFSEYSRLSISAQAEAYRQLAVQKKNVQILAFSIMPNHFHLLLTQETDDGISKFISVVQNGYAKYFDISTKRTGSVFQSMYKAIRMESEEQLLHVARYIHLNPQTANIVNNTNELEKYPWTSYIYYLQKRNDDLINTIPILSQFQNLTSFKKFTEDQSEYQRLLFLESHLYHDYDDNI